MKTQVELLTLSDYAMTSQQGKLSVMGMFERIFVTAVPTKYPRFFVVAILKGKPQSEIEISLQMDAPSGKSVLPKKSLKLKLGSNGKTNIITDVSSLVLPEIGSYKLILTDGKDEIGTSEFFVTKVEDQQQQQKVAE